jgi:hypothetical protein
MSARDLARFLRIDVGQYVSPARSGESRILASHDGLRGDLLLVSNLSSALRYGLSGMSL